MFGLIARQSVIKLVPILMNHPVNVAYLGLMSKDNTGCSQFYCISAIYDLSLYYFCIYKIKEEIPSQT